MNKFSSLPSAINSRNCSGFASLLYRFKLLEKTSFRKNILVLIKNILIGIFLSDVLTLVIGALIGIISSSVTYLGNHFLNIRERKLVRDFEVREKGRDFFHQIYGIVVILSEMVTSFSEKENSENATILTKKGYTKVPKDEIIELYRKAYERSAEFWYDSREKGLEIFLTPNFMEILNSFWAYAVYFNVHKNWEDQKENIKGFKEISMKYRDEMDKLMGLSKKGSRRPKWLNPKNWLNIRRGDKPG